MADRPAPLASGLRFPVQTGASALRQLTLGALTLVPGLLVTLGCVLAVLLFPGVLGLWGWGFVGGAFLGGVGLRNLARAAHRRPNDMVLGPAGVRLEGGRYQLSYSSFVSWPDLNVEAWRTELVRGSWQLRVGSDEAFLVLAQADEPDEVWSLQAIADMVRTTAAESLSPKRAPSSARTLSCPACGAWARPDDADAVACAFCGQSVPVPAQERERIRAARTLRVSQHVTPALIARFLDQPSARQVNAIGGVAALVMLLAWPTTLAAGAILLSQERLNLLNAVALGLLAPACIWSYSALMGAWIANRRALQLVALRMGAARHPSGHLECRLCGAPLGGGAPIVACEYCGAPNLLGLDLRTEAALALSQEEELRDALFACSERRGRALAQVAVALAFFFGLFGLFLVSTLLA